MFTDLADDGAFADLPGKRDAPDAQGYSAPPSAVGGSKGKVFLGVLIVGLGLVLVGAAIAGRFSDESSSTRPVGKLVDSSIPVAATTTTAVPVRTPTTIAGGVLPTGCADWDGAFGFDPDPIEGVAIWSDFEGWHVRLGPDGPDSVSGAVVGQVVPVLSEDPLPAGVEVGTNDEAAKLVFSLTSGPEPVGFDFAADCAQKQLTFELLGPDGMPLDAGEIQVGRSGEAAVVPVIAQRTMTAG